MKKIFTPFHKAVATLLLAFAAVSCSQDSALDSDLGVADSREPISFNVTTTRGSIVTDLAEFSVYAVDDVTGDTVIDHAKFELKNGAWVTEKDFYWTNNLITFYAYTPTATDANGVTMSKDVVGYAMPSDVTAQPDLMVAQCSASSGNVSLQFVRILALVSFKATGENSEISSVAMSGVYDSGLYDYSSWELTNASGDSYSAVVGSANETSGQITTSEGYIMVLPQSGNDVTFTVTNDAGTTKSYTITPTWEAGTLYSYTLDTDKVAATLAITDAPSTMTVGDTHQLDYTVTPSSVDVSWSSSSDAVTVSESGYLEAAAEGTATIVAKDSAGNVLASFDVTVEAVVPITVVTSSGEEITSGDTLEYYNLEYDTFTITTVEGTDFSFVYDIVETTIDNNDNEEDIFKVYKISTTQLFLMVNETCAGTGTITITDADDNEFIINININYKEYDTTTVELQTATIDYTESDVDSNCYIINASDKQVVYHIPIEGRINTYWTDYDYQEANQIDDDTRSGVYAEQLWSDCGIDADDELSVGLAMKDGKKILQVVVPANYATEGNALYAVKSGDDVILWSWHLWITDYNPSTTYLNRYIGQKETSAITGAMLYQFGRKDPFPISDDNGYSVGTTSTVSNAINNPTNIYGVSGTSPSWYISYTSAGDAGYVSNVDYIWGDKFTDNDESTIAKSIYDPSPYGYRLLNYYNGKNTYGGDSYTILNSSLTDYSSSYGYIYVKSLGYNYYCVNDYMILNNTGTNTPATLAKVNQASFWTSSLTSTTLANFCRVAYDSSYSYTPKICTYGYHKDLLPVVPIEM